MAYDWQTMADQLNRLLRLNTTPVGLKKFKTKEEAQQIPKLRWPKHMHSACQLIGQAMSLGFTIGFTADDIAGDNCIFTAGLGAQTDEWRTGSVFVGVWCAEAEDARRHHAALTPIGEAEAAECFVVSPLASGRIQPDVCIINCLPGQAFVLTSGYLRSDYRPIETTIVGESTCSMSWVKTLTTGEVGFGLPCFAEMRYGGFSDGNVTVSMTPAQLEKAIEGMQQLNRVGLRYPIPNYAAQSDIREGLGVSYGDAVKK